MQEQSMIVEGTRPNRIVRELDGEQLYTKEIKKIHIIKHGKKQEYVVTCTDGTPHRLNKVGQNPKYLLFYNKEPIATCGNNYVPLFHKEVKDKTLEVLEALERPVVEIRDSHPKEYQWKMTAVLEKDVEVPVGHFSDPELWDWGIGVTNSYDLSMGIYVSLYLYRQICSNGLYAWRIAKKKHFVHVEKELNPDAILDKLEYAIETMMDSRGVFFSRLESMSKVAPSEEQVALILRRMNVRKYEAEILADQGIITLWDKNEVESVRLGSKVHTEMDILNAVTSLANDVNTTTRQFELQNGIMEKILEARTIVPDL